MRTLKILLLAVVAASCTEGMEPCAIDGEWASPASTGPGGVYRAFTVESRGDSIFGTGVWEVNGNPTTSIVTGIRRNGDYAFESRFQFTHGPLAQHGELMERFTAALYCPDMLRGSVEYGGSTGTITMSRQR